MKSAQLENGTKCEKTFHKEWIHTPGSMLVIVHIRESLTRNSVDTAILLQGWLILKILVKISITLIVKYTKKTRQLLDFVAMSVWQWVCQESKMMF